MNFQVFPDSAHQAEIERYQGHIKLDDNGAHERLTYDLHDKNGNDTLELITLQIVKLTQKTKDIKQLCFLMGNSTRKSTINTRFERRHYNLSRNSITL